MLLVVLLVAAAAACARAALLPLHTERLRATVGGYAVMNCHLDFPFGNEIPYHLQWDKDGEMVLSWLSGWESPAVGERWAGRARRVAGGGGGGGLGGGSLNVSSVREADAGLFHCRVAFPNRSPPTRNNGTFYYLDVDGGTVIAAPPVNVTVVEGERAELECGAKEPAARVTWSRSLPDRPELPARAELLANGSLVLPAALAADAGLYECHVQHEDRQQTAEAYLDVQYKAKVVYAPEERYLPLGKPASLDCHFSANPPLTNLRWEKDGFLFDPYNVPGVFYSRNGSLLFNRVDESHEGQYSCTAYNALGSEGPSPRVRVRVQRPPVLLTRPQPLYLARLGQPLALPCAAAAVDQPHHDPPTVTWTRKDGVPLSSERFTTSEGGKLSISAVAEQDRGVLVCTVSNEAADVSAETELLIENLPPRAPYNLTARATAHAVQLAWVPGRRGVEAEYTVWYRERAAHEWRTLRLLSRGVTEASLTGLRAATAHELRVLATDSLGDGLFSKPLFVTTLDPEVDESEAAFVAAVTETSDGAATAGEDEVDEEAEEVALTDGGAAQLVVAVRLLDEGALVRWAGAGPGRCDLRWFREDDAGRRLVATAHTHHDHLLVSSVEEGTRYWAAVSCGAARGGAGAAVPHYSRLRAVAGGCAAAALLLAAAAAALVLLRRRLPCARRPAPAPQLPPPPPKRRY